MKKAVNKRLQSNDKSVKTGKKTPKKMDKTLVISVSIVAVLALLIVLIITLSGPARAAIQLGRTERFIEKGEISAVVINSAFETEGLLNDKEAVLRDGEAESLVERLAFVLDNVKYSDNNKVNTGVWKTKLVLYNSIDKLELYIDPDGIYIENKGRLICYEVEDGGSSEHKALFSDIEGYLKR